jgi:ABC-type branched-subunit amino acid transport system ATPase component
MDEDLLGPFEIALENGRVVLEGRSEELLTDPRVKKAYLGG